jgi:tRNA-Thr(GGU) m(6)t(6)A37 methyltransferase TsaA
MENKFKIFPVGIINKKDKAVYIDIYPEYTDGLLRLDQYSHILIFYWFHENDTSEKRKILQVHPRGNRANPLTGVFAARSPSRPNPVGISISRVLSVDGNRIHIDQIDARNGSPVIDIKPYFSSMDSIPEANMPGWVEG